MPGDGQVPEMSTLADRLYGRLPEVYRRFDAEDQTWTLKRYIAAMFMQGGEIDDVIERIAGERPVGPATPEPWGLRGFELEQWRANRTSRPSALADPSQADAAWLPWLAQLVGATLDPGATEQEKRDTIRYATSGWRGGTRAAIADAAKTALTGTRYARVVPHMKPGMSGGLQAGLIWDITIVTRASETPDANAVLGAVLRKGVKPAGVVLWHAVYEATWDQIEAIYPMWFMREALTWDEQAQAGLMYEATPDNDIPNPSFEVNTTGWAAHGSNSTIGRVLGGVDGVGMLRVTAIANGTGEVATPDIPVTMGARHFSFSIRPDISRDGQFVANYYNGVSFLSAETVQIPTLPADEWTRISADLTVPATTTRMIIWVQLDGMLTAELFDLDAFYSRSI